MNITIIANTKQKCKKKNPDKLHRPALLSFLVHLTLPGSQ